MAGNPSAAKDKRTADKSNQEDEEEENQDKNFIKTIMSLKKEASFRLIVYILRKGDISAKKI